jgi:hypothetical protein
MIPEQLFGLTANQVVAYAAVWNVVLVLVLVGVTSYYAWQAKQQAKAGRDQVAASNRQADAAQKTLDLLLTEKERQRRIDVSTVRFQLEAAINMIDDWRNRIASESFDLPDVIEMRPTNFSSAIPNADRIDQIVAGYMGAALLYIAKAETDVRVIRDKDPDQYAHSELAFAKTMETRERLRVRADTSLNTARFKLGEARSYVNALFDGERRPVSSTSESNATEGL